jgi:hypothetical protein
LPAVPSRLTLLLAASGIARDVQRPPVPRVRANSLPETSSSAFTHSTLSDAETCSIA